MFYEQLKKGVVQCHLCRFRCRIETGRRGICGVRENSGGKLYSLVYGLAVAEQVDPIEKKPLYHVLPGSRSFSVATAGCNFRCQHCQNYSISQVPATLKKIPGKSLSPMEIVAKAQASDCRSISYTYTEPTVFFEYAFDTAMLANAVGLKNIFVTNGYISPEALKAIHPYLDAANIDLKGFSDRFYREVAHAALGEVLDCIIEYKRLGIWIELTTLIIPGWNDNDAELQAMARFIVDKVGPDTPWHVSAFYPTYQMTDRPPTPPSTLNRAREIGMAAGLRYVYEGNVPDSAGSHTWCPACKAELIRRNGYYILSNRIKDGACPECGNVIAGIEMAATL
jgi:pyruvate formate lyase activating enzyme